MIKRCAVDGVEFEASRPHAKYCSQRCQKRAQRRPGGVQSLAAPLSVVAGEGSPERGALESAALKRLQDVGRAESDMGIAALLAARRLDRVGMSETGAGFAALMREYRSAMETAVQVDGQGNGDALDEIQQSAALKLLGHGRRAPA